MPIAIPTELFSDFAIIQYFKNAFGLRPYFRIVWRQIEQGFLPILRRIQWTNQDDFFNGRQLAIVYLVWDKTPGPESPEQVVQMPALFDRVGEYIANTTATIRFLYEFAGKQIPIL